MKKIALLGSTGSIGQNTLRIVRHLPEQFTITALAAHSNIDLLSEQITLFRPELVAVYVEEKALELKRRFPHLRIVTGEEGLQEVAAYEGANFVVMAVVGMQALKPTLAAIEAGKPVGLASKEVLVSAGEYLSTLARTKGVPLLPIDSEHSALFQTLEGRDPAHVRRVVLTASGGPFRSHSLEQLHHVTVEEALNHPTWKMGPKVTVDSSNLMNKGLEMIEARWLFNLPPEKIEVVIHPQSLVHCFVEFIDGILLAQVHEPNMIYPIQYALGYPTRYPGMFRSFDFTKNGRMDFISPDLQKFPALELAQEALIRGKSIPCYLNAANEVLVGRFLKREISWREITTTLERLLARHKVCQANSLETLFSIDQEARMEAEQV